MKYSFLLFCFGPSSYAEDEKASELTGDDIYTFTDTLYGISSCKPVYLLCAKKGC